MKPKTELEHTVVRLSAKLPALSQAAAQDAQRHGCSHYVRLHKSLYTCATCNHTWNAADEAAKQTKCPNCHAVGEVYSGKRITFKSAAYYCTVSTIKGLQVCRYYRIDAHYKIGEQPRYEIREAWQRWLTADGRTAVIGRSRFPFGHYIDTFAWDSPMDLRRDQLAYQLTPSRVYPRVRVLDIFRKRGYSGDFYDINPEDYLKAIVTDNRAETLAKVGQYGILMYYLYRSEKAVNNNWQTIKILMRHNYRVSTEQVTEYFVYLQQLSRLNRDLHNPIFVCPTDFREAADQVSRRLAAQQERQRAAQERERQRREAMTTEDLTAVYRAEKARYLGLVFAVDNITIRPLQDVTEFYEEAEALHHCVYSNRYFEKVDSLILSAKVDGQPTETIEVSLANNEVLQCRGKYNQPSEYHARIFDLMQHNLCKIAECI